MLNEKLVINPLSEG